MHPAQAVSVPSADASKRDELCGRNLRDIFTAVVQMQRCDFGYDDAMPTAASTRAKHMQVSTPDYVPCMT